MKIIAHTDYAYIVEMSAVELSNITGEPKHNVHAWQNHNRSSYSHVVSHPIGTEFKVSETWDHLQSLLRNEGDRVKIAESLRAAATLIEHTPSPITVPQKPATTEAA